LPMWNIYNFFVLYANLDGWNPDQDSVTNKNILDEWLESLLNKLIIETTKNLEEYNTVDYVYNLQKFIDDFSKWYIRRSRDRVGPSAEDKEDKLSFYSTTYNTLLTLMKLSAPVVPFVSEEIYKNL